MELRRIYVVANETKPRALRVLVGLKAWCQERRIEAVPVDQAAPADAEGAIVLTLGGDGTVLRAASLFAESAIPILGINVGSLGFLTQAPLEDLTHALEHVLSDEYSIEERMRLAYFADGIKGSVLNDLVVTDIATSRFCELTLSWGDGHVAEYPGDGLIVATSTGSTAYSLSAGGPIIVPPAACILVTPHAVHRLGLRPTVFPAEEILHVTARTEAMLIADGDQVGRLAEGAGVVIRRCDQPTQLIRLSDAPSFFDVLNEKLNWAGS